MRTLAAVPAFLLICTAFVASPTAAAEFTRRGSVIYITGEIGPYDYVDFMQARGDLKRGSIVLNSPGGFLTTAWLIGNNINIHSRQFETVVRSGDVCSSVCTLIWLAGKPRHLGRLAKLGFHSVAYPNTEMRNDEGNREFADFMRRIGVPQQVIDLQPMADPCCLNYVDYLQAKVWGLLKERPTKQELQEVADRKTVWSKPSPSPFPDPPSPTARAQPGMTIEDYAKTASRTAVMANLCPRYFKLNVEQMRQWRRIAIESGAQLSEEFDAILKVEIKRRNAEVDRAGHRVWCIGMQRQYENHGIDIGAPTRPYEEEAEAAAERMKADAKAQAEAEAAAKEKP
jgi:hypothetical protein